MTHGLNRHLISLGEVIDRQVRRISRGNRLVSHDLPPWRSGYNGKGRTFGYQEATLNTVALTPVRVTIDHMDPATLVRETVLVPRKTSRPPGPDEWASERIRHEREQRGWSTAELARRVSLAGVPMLQQTVWKIESGTPRRKLTVGEAAAFASVFDITLDQLMRPPADDVPHELVRLALEFRSWRLAEGAQASRLVGINERIARLTDAEMYTADVVAKFTPITADQAVTDLETIIANLQDVLAAVRRGNSAWRMVASAVDLVPEGEAGTEPAPGEVGS